MVVESMHKTIKYKYFNGSVVNRLDKAMFKILEFLKNKSDERMQNTLKYKSKTRTIFVTHIKSINIQNLYSIEKLNQNDYLVEKKEDLKKYNITFNPD
jgi:hypothetical protein